MEEGFEVVNLSASGVIPTPNIRTNGNWFVGNKDTGVAAKGETGSQGPQGEKGDQGIQGIQGEKGEKGTDADTSELERLSNEVNTINQSLPHFVTYSGTVNATTSVNGGYFGQIALSSCTGYDPSITPHSILRGGCYAELNSGIQGSIERSGNNLNVYGPVSGIYHFGVSVMYFK